MKLKLMLLLIVIGGTYLSCYESNPQLQIVQLKAAVNSSSGASGRFCGRTFATLIDDWPITISEYRPYIKGYGWSNDWAINKNGKNIVLMNATSLDLNPQDTILLDVVNNYVMQIVKVR